MAQTNLTNILFAGLIITFTITVFIGQYANFAVMNNSTIEEPYKSVFYNISSKYSDFEDVGGTVADKGLITNILNFGENLVTGTVNVFVTGLKAMGTFFEMIPLFGDILSAIAFGIPQLSGLIALLTLLVAIFIGMHYIKSASNKNDLP
ncbi:MAG: hypothetical protein PHS54_01225 [Clostridia bacterium]|nr:hypothetical protein [Clostridia bacterium]